MAPTLKAPEQQNGTAPSAPTSATQPRVQPVALEISVTVNGVRTAEGSDKREPFSETTQTVLVFGTGAVIRLNSTVATGQLLFLTNEKTKKEVVCQVVKSKNYRSASGYVELEFTEPAIGFWGMRFPTDRIAPVSASTGTPAPAVSAKPTISVPVEAKTAEPVLPAKPAVVPPPAAKLPLASAVVLPPAPVNAVPVVSAKPEAAPADSELIVPIAPPVVDSATEELKRQTARLQEQLSTSLFEEPSAPTPPPASEQPVLQFDAIAMSDATAQIFDMAGPESGGHTAHTEPSIAAAPKMAQPQDVALKAKIEKSAGGQNDEAVRIPAWLEPLARNAATFAPPVSSTPTTSARAMSTIVSPPTAAVQTFVPSAPEPISQPAANVVSLPSTIAEPDKLESDEKQVARESYDFGSKIELEPVAAKSEPKAPRFGTNLFGSRDEFAAEPASGGSKKGLWIGAIAATVLLAAGGGWWYMQQNGRAAASSPSSFSSPESQRPAAQSQGPESFQTASLPQNPSGSAFSNPSPLPAQPSNTNNSNKTVAPVKEVQKIGNGRDGLKSAAASATARATEPIEQPSEQTRKSSFKKLHLEAPTVKGGKTENLSNEADPGFAMENQPASSAGTMNLGLTGNGGPKAPVPVGGEVASAQLVTSVPPVYPQMAKTQRLSGDVKIDALIDENGRVTGMKVVSGPVILHQAAMDALRQWRFKPAMLNGSAVSMHLMVTVQFRLK